MSRIRKLLEEVNSSDDEKSDEDGFSSDNSGEEDCLEEDVHVLDFDSSMLDSQNLQESPDKKKSKFGAWVEKHKTTRQRKNASKFHERTKSSNIIKFRQGLIGLSLDSNSPVNFWEVFIRPDVINLLVKYTNIAIATKQES